MDPSVQRERQQAHSYLDHLPDAQVTAVRGLLEAMLDPISRALANAPVDEEAVTKEEDKALAEARQWLRQNKAIPHEQVLAELGITREEIDSYQEPVWNGSPGPNRQKPMCVPSISQTP